MKVLFKKLKKCNKIQKAFYFSTSILYLIGLVYFILNLLKLTGIETGLRVCAIVVFSIWFFLYILGTLICMITKRNKLFVFTTIINILCIAIFACGGFGINYLVTGLGSFSKDKVTYTTNLITMNNTEFTSSSKIGMISNEDEVEGNVLAKKLIEKENLSNEIVSYDDYFELMYDLYNGNIDAIFITSNYAVIYGSIDTYENITDEVKVIYEYSEEMNNEDNISTNKSLTEPFTMLIMGVDSTLDGLNANQAFNGDTLILVTFNPDTLSATMLSIPRDMYVPIACRNNAYDKINSSAAYGSSCVIDTVENITDVTIDYYVKINFQGVVDLVDALGGVTVDVAKPDMNTYKGQVCEQDSKRRKGSNLVCMDTGIQTLNGEQALAYARCRHLYLRSDIDRNAHQQAIIEALAKKLKTINSLDEIKDVINTVSKNIDSNMSTDQILSFYSVCKDMLFNASSDNDTLLSIKKSYLEYYSLPVYLTNSHMYTSALGYYNSSMNAIIHAMKVNLGLEEEEMVKTFEIDYNENYETKLIGQGLTDSNKLETLPNFVGKTEDYVRTWCSNRGISVTVDYGDSSATYGSVINQSLHEGVFVKNISRLTITLSNEAYGVVE